MKSGRGNPGSLDHKIDYKASTEGGQKIAPPVAGGIKVDTEEGSARGGSKMAGGGSDIKPLQLPSAPVAGGLETVKPMTPMLAPIAAPAITPMAAPLPTAVPTPQPAILLAPTIIKPTTLPTK